MRVLEHRREIVGRGESDGSWDMSRVMRQGDGSDMMSITITFMLLEFYRWSINMRA